MPSAGFEPMIPVFERTQIFLALYHGANVIDGMKNHAVYTSGLHFAVESLMMVPKGRNMQGYVNNWII
jgi:hypothetical protein